MPNRSCQISTDMPKDAAIELAAVPTMTSAATTLRVSSSMIMKISVSADTTAIIRSNFAPSAMSLKVAAVPPRYTLASDSEDCFSPSCAALRSDSTREMPSGVIGSPWWVMKKRADLPSGDRNIRSPVWKSGLSNASGGR